MPYCEVGRYKVRANEESNGNGLDNVKDQSPARLFYRLFGSGDTKILMIMGLAGSHEAWHSQLLDLAGTLEPNEHEPENSWQLTSPPWGAQMKTHNLQGFNLMFNDVEEDTIPVQSHAEHSGRQVCIYDNRGVGKSSIPKRKSDYSTTIMAEDAVALLDHLGWRKAHVFGHSMGGMIACKLAAIAPHRVASLGVISVTGGGWECIPKLDKKMLSISYRFLRSKTPEDRASVDLDTHYTEEYLNGTVDGGTRREILFKEYVSSFAVSGMQPKHGLDGHSNACWYHRVTEEDAATIVRAGILVSVIHGRSDIVATLDRATALAARLAPSARLVVMDGAHFVIRESALQVNEAILDLIRGAEAGVEPAVWSSAATSAASADQGTVAGTFDPAIYGWLLPFSFFTSLHSWISRIVHFFRFEDETQPPLDAKHK